MYIGDKLQKLVEEHFLPFLKAGDPDENLCLKARLYQMGLGFLYRAAEWIRGKVG